MNNSKIILASNRHSWHDGYVSKSEQAQRKGLASRASIPERGAMWRALRNLGIPINSTWIDEDGEGQTADMTELWSRIHDEVMRSEALILYVEPGDFPLKGALVEVGIALGRGIPVRVVMPGVTLDQPSCRPIGSWIRHPLVSIHKDWRSATSK